MATPIYLLLSLNVGGIIEGPAMVIDQHADDIVFISVAQAVLISKHLCIMLE